jgi:ABC-2 type transport system ATP-binding protein
VPGAIVEVERLTHSYGLRVALHELTLRIEAGEIFALLGPNGSGKTTLFRILSTLIKPQDGRAEILGKSLLTHADEVRREIGVVFQAPSLDKQLTAAENLRYHGNLYGLGGEELRKRTAELLRRVGLDDRARERVGTFSGGMRRRVEIAKGLLHHPRVLLLDEPSTGLDPAARLEIWRYLEEVRKADGVTVILTTHLMDEADRCDRVAILDAGRLIACDSPANLKQKIGGDVITISTADAEGAQRVLRDRLEVDSQIIGNVVRVEHQRGHELLPKMIDALGPLADQISLGRPTLEDVFIRVTGRKFETD